MNRNKQTIFAFLQIFIFFKKKRGRFFFKLFDGCAGLSIGNHDFLVGLFYFAKFSFFIWPRCLDCLELLWGCVPLFHFSSIGVFDETITHDGITSF
jgi:hypothetical protein